MRVNLYNEELTRDVQFVSKVAETNIEYFGLRFFLKSAQELHHTPTDDDRSAITFWFGRKLAALEFLEGVTRQMRAEIQNATQPESEHAYEDAYATKEQQ